MHKKYTKLRTFFHGTNFYNWKLYINLKYTTTICFDNLLLNYEYITIKAAIIAYIVACNKSLKFVRKVYYSKMIYYNLYSFTLVNLKSKTGCHYSIKLVFLLLLIKCNMDRCSNQIIEYIFIYNNFKIYLLNSVLILQIVSTGKNWYISHSDRTLFNCVY